MSSACAERSHEPALASDAADTRAGAATHASRPSPNDRTAFATDTRSPAPAPVEETFAACGAGDTRLATVARRVAEREASGKAPWDGEELAFALRAAGEPHVWPHEWTLSGPSLDDSDVKARLGRWLASFSDGGVRRCGAARADAGGTYAVAVVAVDALADLSPLPTSARAGQWIRFEATMLANTDGAKLVVLGPRGAPRTVPTTVSANVVRANFAAEEPGAFTVQLLASLAHGPRPVLEARVFADVKPDAEFVGAVAPGEAAGTSAATDDDALLRMIDAARMTESLAPLRRAAELDRIALEHARAMQETGRLAHDAGDGEPGSRLRTAGIATRRFGENVARSTTVARAHRVLWASPSHRENLLDPHFDAVGVGVVRDAGEIWVCEVFADFTGAETGRPVRP